jgi:hypothetical protein
MEGEYLELLMEVLGILEFASSERKYKKKRQQTKNLPIG